jgi:hypothetical protein
MLRDRLLVFVSLVLAFVHVLAFTALSQGVGLPRRTDQSVFEEAFPWPARDIAAAPLTIAMRFRPSFHAESAIVLRFDENGTAAVEYVKAGVRISEFLSKPNASANGNSLTTALRLVERRQAGESTVGKEWLEGFWDSLTRSPISMKETMGRIQLDGTRYELQVVTGLNTWKLTIVDDEVENGVSGDMPIVRWMNSVRVAVDALQ